MPPKGDWFPLASRGKESLAPLPHLPSVPETPLASILRGRRNTEFEICIESGASTLRIKTRGSGPPIARVALGESARWYSHTKRAKPVSLRPRTLWDQISSTCLNMSPSLQHKKGYGGAHTLPQTQEEPKAPNSGHFLFAARWNLERIY